MRISAIKAIAVWAILLLSSTLAYAGTVTYVYTDTQGTPLAKANANATITAVFDYAPYGAQALGSPPSGPGYTGHVNDPDTGFIYMQARYYDPSRGRFLSVDPVVPVPGNVYGFNRYGYANNNPYKYVDPDGRMVCDGIGGRCGDIIIPGLERNTYPIQRLQSESGTKAGSSGCDADECQEYQQINQGILRKQGERLQEAGIYGAKEAGWMLAGGALGKVFSRFGRVFRLAGKEVSYGAKIEGQLGKRGWSKDMVSDAVNNPVRAVITTDTRHMSGGVRMNDPATAFYGRYGGYVVRNNRTGDIVQVSDRFDSGWVAPWD